MAKKDTTAFAGIPVQIESKTATSDWSALSSPLIPQLSAIDGTLSFGLIIGENTQFRIRSAGSWDRLAGLSQPFAINVARLISWSPPTSMKAGVTYSITGQVQPKIGGVTVQLDDGTGAKASTMSTVKTLADGTFTFTLAESRPGVKSYRILIPGDAAFMASKTEFVKVVVR